MTVRRTYEDAPIPQLLRDARGAYGDAARRALAESGFDDMPGNGGFMLATLDQGTPDSAFSSQSEAVSFLRVSKQASSQLIDTLVLRGYLERRNDPEDRRRMTVRVTDRGRAAAASIQLAVDAVDAALEGRLSAAELRGLRAGLAALAEIREASSRADEGDARDS